MNAPDPLPPPPPIFRPIERSTTAALVGGAPLAIVTVWVIQTYWLPKGQTLDATTATAFGTVGSIFFGELWLVVRAALDRLTHYLST